MEKSALSQVVDPMVTLTKSLASSDFEISKSGPNDTNRSHPTFSLYKNRSQDSKRDLDQGMYSQF